MTALYIIIGILILFAVLLNCPVVIQVQYKDELYARIGYLFFHYVISPRPAAAKPEKEEPEKEEAPKKNRFRELLQKKGFSGFLEICQEVSAIISKANKELFEHLIIVRFNLEVSVTGEDAAQTAMNYGYVCGLVGSAAGLFLGNVRCKNYHISINPDFQGEKSSVVFDSKSKIGLKSFLYGGLRALIRTLKVIKTLKTINNN